MKTILIALFALSAFAQATINAPAVTLDSTGSTAILAWMAGQGTGQTSTLTGPITAAATNITVVSAAGIGASAVISIGTEHIQVVSKAGNVLTVTRAANGTVAASAASGATVTELKYKTLNALGKQVILDVLRQIIKQQLMVTAQATADANSTASAAVAVQ